VYKPKADMLKPETC